MFNLKNFTEMRKVFLKSMLLLCALIVGSGSLWAAEGDIHDMSITQSTNLNNNASIPSVNIDEQSYSIKKVTINWRYNKTIENPVTIEVIVGGNSWGTETISGNTTDDVEFSGSSTTGAVAINFTNNTGSGTGHGTFYVNSVKLTEGAPAIVPGTTTAPAITGNQIFAGSTTVTITNDESATGAAIYYTLNGSDPTTTTSETCFSYSAPFTIDASKTVKAIAKHANDENASPVASKEFTKVEAKANIAALVAAGTNGYVQLTNALVTYKSGSNAYLEDESGAIYLMGCADDLAAGDKISGLMNVTNYTTYYSLPEIKAFSLVDGFVKTSGNTVTPTEVTLISLLENYNSYLSRYVIIRGATVTSAFSSKNSTIKQGENTIVLRDQNSSATLSTTKDDVINVTAHPAIYNTTKQIAVWAQSQIVVKNSLSDNAISGINDAYTLDLVADGGISVLDLSGATATSGGTVYFKLIDATMESTEYVLDGSELTVSAKGTITIKAYVNANDDYKYAEKSISVTVLGEKSDPVFNIENQTISCEATFTVTSSNYTTDGDVTLFSSNSAVASVSGMVVTANAVGTATITISAAEGTEYKAGSTTFEVTVPAPTGKTTKPAPLQEIVYEEDFSVCDGEGGNDDKWSGSLTAGDNKPTGWTWSNEYSADECMKLGKTSGVGSATTPAITVENGKEYHLSFKAAPWSAESTTMSVSVTGGSITGVSTSEMTGSQWNDFTGTITASSTSIKITFTASNNRFFLDEVALTEDGATPTISATLNSDGYSTFCSEYPLDFSGATGYTAWYVTSANTESGVVTFSQITGNIEGGQGILIKGTPNATITLNSTNSSNELSGNKLVGCLAPTFVEGTANKYVMVYAADHTEFQKLHNGSAGINVTIPAGKAYLDLDGIGGAPDRLRIVFEENDATNIDAIDATEEAVKFIENGKLYIKKNGVVYDMLGTIVR